MEEYNMNKELKLKIDGMTCRHCQASVEKALNSIEGITAMVDLETGEANLLLTKEVDHGEIEQVVADAGYEVTEITGS